MRNLIQHTNGSGGHSGIEIEADSVQDLAPPDSSQRFEGIAFSSSGNIVGVATSDTNTVFLFRRRPDGVFEDTPYWTITGPSSRLNYPHDLSFAQTGNTELLAVAQRGGSIAIYEKNKTTDDYGTEPVFEICGPETRLNYSDGVAFVPPHNDYLAACNLETGTISFYRRIPASPFAFTLKPVFELKHGSIYRPDGLGFSPCGKWLAVANHGNHTVSIFKRRHCILSTDKFLYRPVTIVEDPGMRYPHSVAFTSKSYHLIVTNAGANYISIYEPKKHGFRMRWSQSPVFRQTIGPDNIFKDVNARNKMEGGPKGVAVYKNSLALCSPEHGLKIYSFRESLLEL
jgi:DNA-binding beta-propeller fold protein YncE